MRPTDNLEGLKDIPKILRDPQKIVQALGDQSQPTTPTVVPHAPSSRPMPPQTPSNISQNELDIGAKIDPTLLEKKMIEALIVKNPDTFNKLDKKKQQLKNVMEQSMNKEIVKNLAMLNQSNNLPVINRSWGGVVDFITDVGMDIGRDVLGDVAGGVVGAGLQSLTTGLGGSGFTDTIGALLDSPVGRGVVRGGVQYGIPYLEEKLFGTDYYSPGGPSLESALFSGAGTALEEYYSADPGERAMFGEVGLTKDDAIELKRRNQLAKERRAAAKGPFYKSVGRQAGIDKIIENPRLDTKAAQKQLQTKLIGSSVRPLLKAMEEKPVQQQPTQQAIAPSKFIPKLSKEVGGKRPVVTQPRVNPNNLSELQNRQLREQGFTFFNGRRITKEDLVGRVQYADRTKPVRATQSGGLVSLAKSGPVHISQHPQYEKIGLTPAEKGSLGDPTFAYQNAQFNRMFPSAARGDKTTGDIYLSPADGGVQSDPHIFQRYMKWIDSIGGPENLDKQAVRQGILTRGPFHNESGYDEFPLEGLMGPPEAGALFGVDASFLNPRGRNFRHEWRALNRGRGLFGENLGPMPSALEKIAPLLSSSSDISIGFGSSIPVSQALSSLSGDSSGLGTVLSKFGPSAANRNFVLKLLGADTEEDIEELLEETKDKESANILSQVFTDLKLTPAATGGSVNLKRGGSPKQETIMKKHFSGLIGGEGHGMEDNVQMPIVSDGQQIATLAVSPDEYVFDAYTVAALGNGSAKEGGKILDQVVKDIRAAAYGTDKQPNEINGSEELKISLSGLA
jgi:hypothetical protein